MREREEVTDHDLVLQAKAGDRDAFYTVVKRYQRMVWRQCMRVARKVEIADELSQQVFLKAFTKLKTFRGEAPFGAWLFRVAFNVARDWKRSAKNADAVDLEEVEIPVQAREEAELTMVQSLEQLRTAIEGLPEKQRQVVLLRVYEDYSFKEIAAAMGGSEGTAKVNFHYALKSLRLFMHASGQCLGRTSRRESV
jgi:RNA polymerase sigma-70 factor (ECF subfamily)